MNAQQIRKFVNFVTEGYENKSLLWEVRLIDKSGKVKQYFFSDKEKLEKYFENDYLKSWNCYLGILPRTKEKGTVDAIEFGNTFVADLDSEEAIKKVEEIQKKLFDLNLRASLIAVSGHGLHVYFKLKEIADVKTWKKLQEKIIFFFKKHFPEFNPDLQLKDPTRVMRVIGSLNLKGENPIESYIVAEDYTTYKLSDLENILKDITVGTEQSVVLRQIYQKKHIPKWLENVLKHGIDKGERNHWRFVIAVNLWKRGFTEEEVKEVIRNFNRRCRPPEDEAVVECHLKRIVEDADKFLKNHPDININDFSKIIEIYQNETSIKVEPLPVVWDRDLSNIKTSEIKWFVEGFVPEKSVVMLAGKRASYKSWAAIHLALAMASGKQAFNKFGTNKVNVLYIDEENGLDELQRRVRKIKRGMGLDEDLPHLGFLSFENLKIERETDRKKIENFLERYNPCVIIVDCFRRIISAEENDATAMNEVFNYIRQLSKNFDVTWVLLHHLRKGISGRKPDDVLDELRGSSEITNVAESVIVFDRPSRLDNRFILRHSKARRSKTLEPQIIELKWDDSADSLVFECVGTAEEIIDSVDLCMRAIMIWIEENGIENFKTNEVKAAIDKDGYSAKTIQRSLNALVQQGKIIRVKRGQYKVLGVDLSEFIEGTNGQKGHDPSDSKKQNKIRDNRDNVYTNDSTVPSIGRDNRDKPIYSDLSVPSSISKLPLDQVNIRHNRNEAIDWDIHKCFRCHCDKDLTQITDDITGEPLWICSVCLKEKEAWEA